MSFILKNKYFLQKLNSKLKALYIEDRQAEYNRNKSDIKKRVSEYYAKTLTDNNCIINSKVSFYNDLIYSFGEYDIDFILMNLLLEENFIDILMKVKTNNISKTRLNDCNTSLGFFMNNLNRRINNALSIEKEFSDYLKNNFYEFIPTDEFSWDESKYKNNSSISHKYAEYLIETISYEFPAWKTIILNHLLFIKSYNHLSYFNINKPIQSILFIDKLISEYNLHKHKKNVKLVELVYNINSSIHSNCFVKYTKTPICMNKSEAEIISTGLANRVEELKQLIQIESIINKTEQGSYFELYKLSNKIPLEKLNKHLNRKVDLGSFISQEEIEKIQEYSINKSELSESKDLIFEKFYVFDQIELRK